MNFVLSLSSPFLVFHISSHIVSSLIVTYGFWRCFEIVIYQINVLLFDQYRNDKKRFEAIKKIKQLKEYEDVSIEEAIEINNNKIDGVKTPPPYAIRGYRRLVILLIHNYFEIIFWFSAGYLFYINDFKTNFENSFVIEAIYSSFVTMTAFGDKLIVPRSSFGAIILFIQSLFGLLLTLISLARFISILPEIKSKDEFENIG